MGKPFITRLCRRTIFFSSLVKSLNDRYPQLFQKDSQEAVPDGEGSGEKEGNNGQDDSDTDNSFGAKWEWVSWISSVSKELGISWFETYKIKVMVFLNVICFLIDKANEEKRQLEQWKRKH